MGSLMKALLAAVALVAVMEFELVGANFLDQCNITWNPENAQMTEGGEHLTLSLRSNTSGCMLQTKKTFMYGSISTSMMLVKNNSAGTVTTYYTTSLSDHHDEIDFEFLGNSSGDPYTIHTNIFTNGTGDREVQFKPWFDPTTGFNNYTIFWNPCMIVYPIRVFRNYEKEGVPFPTKQPMWAFSSIWSAEGWATQGGRVKTDWSLAPFVAEYRDLNLQVCECADGADDATCADTCASSTYAATECSLSTEELRQMKALQLGYTIYNYCDNARKPDSTKPVPPECDMEQY
ncbi:unnamed protein product [Alopecurus aequalis]